MVTAYNNPMGQNPFPTAEYGMVTGGLRMSNNNNNNNQNNGLTG